MSTKAKEKYEIPLGKRWKTYNCPGCGKFMTHDYGYNTMIARLKKKLQIETTWDWSKDLSKLVSGLKSNERVGLLTSKQVRKESWEIQDKFTNATIRECNNCGTIILLPK
jgi:hypothetical protein